MRADPQGKASHELETYLIPNLLAVPADRRPSVDVYGTDYPTPDGTAARDYLHVVDLGDAHLAALQAVQPGQDDIVNLGTGAGYFVQEVLDACREVTGHLVSRVVSDLTAWFWDNGVCLLLPRYRCVEVMSRS
ncbi:MAG: NAD-dependent epimerase/dehydratase family protein [Dermatophilaceae bacterium]|nr:NAD-dependent epimerase/dehydratase family protein [Dermatophilaceae bacterium]